MTQQDDITQRVLTAEHHLNELMRLTQPWPNATIPCATVRSHVEQALSKLPAAVADERAAFDDFIYERVCSEQPYSHFDVWQARAALASAPVAGEAQPVAWLHQCRKKPELTQITMKKHEPSLAAKGYRPMPLYAAPQASAEDVRNAALEQAAQACEAITKRFRIPEPIPATRQAWDAIELCATTIRTLKTQADKDGGQQRNWVSDWSAAIKSLPMGRSEGAVDKSPNLQGSSVDRSTDLQGRGDDVVLPPLPSPPVHRGHALFAGSQMQTYARAAVLADRQQRAGDGFDVEAAAKTMAECMDYPWAHMPEKGREQMRLHAQSVIRAALSAPQAEQGERDA